MATVTSLLLLTICEADAQQTGKPTAKTLWAPPPMGWPDSIAPSTVPREMIGGLKIANFQIDLGSTKLEDAHRRFGGIIGHQGDAGGALAWICLRGTGSAGRWLLWLSSGEIDGPAIGGFQWREMSADERADSRCVELPKGDDHLELPIELRPGATKLDVSNLLGVPTLVARDTFFYARAHPETIHKISYTVSNSIAVAFRKGKVSAIEVNKTTSD